MGFFDSLKQDAQDVGGFFGAIQRGALGGLGQLTQGAGKVVSGAGQDISQTHIPLLSGLAGGMVGGFGNSMQQVGQLEQGQNPYAGMTGLQTAGAVGQTALNAASFLPIGAGIRGAEAGVGIGGRFLGGALEGAKAGAAFGGASGLASGLQQQNPTVGSVAGSTATGGLLGAGLGAAGGGLFGAISKGATKSLDDPAVKTAQDFQNGQKVEGTDNQVNAHLNAVAKLPGGDAVGFDVNPSGPDSQYTFSNLKNPQALQNSMLKQGIPAVMLDDGRVMVHDTQGASTSLINQTIKENNLQNNVNVTKGYAVVKEGSNATAEQPSLQPNAESTPGAVPDQGAANNGGVQNPVLPAQPGNPAGRLQEQVLSPEEKTFHESLLGRPMTPEEETNLAQASQQIEANLGERAKAALSQANSKEGELVPTAVKEEGKLQKSLVGVSKGRLVERQGQYGQELADRMNGSLDRQTDLQVAAEKAMPTVMKVNKNDAERLNFIKAVQGEARPMSADVQQAVAEWRSWSKDFRQTGVDAKLNIHDLGDTYFPHNIDYKALTKDKNAFNTAINHLIQTKQVGSQTEAIQLLRSRAKAQGELQRFGNFESPRVADLPDYKTDKSVIPGYIKGGSKRIAQAESFGANGEIKDALLGKIAKDGHDAETAADAFDKFLRPAENSQAGKQVRGALSFSKLAFTPLKHAFQSSLPAVEAGVTRLVRGGLQLFDPETRQLIKDAGVTRDIRGLQEQEGFQGAVGKGTAVGIKPVMQANRNLAAATGKVWAEDLAPKAAQGNQYAVNTLRMLGVKGDIASTLTREQTIQAMRGLVGDTMFRSTPLDSPLTAEEHPFISQWRLSYGYKVTGFMYNQVYKPALQGNFGPLIRAIPVLGLAGFGSMKTEQGIKSAIGGLMSSVTGKPQPAAQAPQSLPQQVLQAYTTGGALGLPGELLQGLNYIQNSKGQIDPFNAAKEAASTVAPALGTAADAVKAVAGSVNNQSLQPLARFGLQQTPLVGSQLANALTPAQSATPMATTGTSNLSSTGGGSSLSSGSGTNSKANFAARGAAARSRRSASRGGASAARHARAQAKASRGKIGKVGGSKGRVSAKIGSAKGGKRGRV